MIKLLWVSSSLALLFAIMIHNPKSQGIGSQNQMFGNTRSAEANLNKITWGLIIFFFSLAVYLAMYNRLQ